MCRVKSSKFTLALVLAAVAGCAHNRPMTKSGEPSPATVSENSTPSAGNALAVKAEKVRTDCIAGRRLICGRIIKVLPDGLVVDSGYTDLLRPPLTESWLIPGTVPARRASAAIELQQPGAPCFGLILLTDTPRRPKPRAFDYVVIMGYPAGAYNYQPAPGIQKPIRKFAAGLDTAVRSVLRGQENGPAAAGRQ